MKLGSAPWLHARHGEFLYQTNLALRREKFLSLSGADGAERR